MIVTVTAEFVVRLNGMNRNSYAIYRMVPFPMTLNEPEWLSNFFRL